jgi:TP901 family phage tail tape measure protein
MADVYKRGIYLYINGQEIENNVKKITGEMKKLVNEQGRMTIGSREYNEAASKIKALRGVLAEHQAQLKQTAGGWLNLKNAADKFNRYFGLVGSFIAGLTGMVLGFKKAVEVANLFEERMGNLSALTGLTGKNLEWLGENAKKSSIKITESGVRIKQSASDIVDAYTKMGSARPDLLKNKEALAQVTEQAIILAEAGKIDLQEAIFAVAASMNQFNLDASQSERIINVLAAGALEGSAEIGDLTSSMKNVGTVAADSNLSLEQTVAMLEVLGEKQLKGEEAGTKFRGALLKMKDAGVGYVSGMFNVRDAIVEVNAKLIKLTSAKEQDALKQKVFGIENVTAGTILLQNIEKYDKLTAAVTGTNVATTQAVVNTDNNNAKLAQAKNRVDLLTMALGEKLAPAMTFSTNSFSYFLKAIMAAPEWLDKNRVLIVSLVGAVLAYNGALIASIATSAWERAAKLLSIKSTSLQILMTEAQTAQIAKLTIVQKAAVVTQWLLNAAQAANPVGLVIAGITALIAAMMIYSRNSKEARALDARKKEMTDSVTASNQELGASYDMLREDQAKLSRMSGDQKRDLEQQLDATIKLAEANYDLQKSKRGELRADNTRLNAWQFLTTWSASGRLEKARAHGLKAVKDIDVALEESGDKIKALKDQKLTLNDILTAEAAGDQIGSESLDNLESKLQLYGTALKNVAINGPEYIRIQKKIAEVEKALAKAKGAGGSAEEKKYDKDKALADLTKAHIDRQNELKRQRAAGIIDQETYNNDLENEDIRYNQEAIIRLTKAGQSIQEEQGKINDIMIKKQEDCEKEKEEIDEKYWKSVEYSMEETMALEDKKAKEEKDAAVQKRADQLSLVSEIQGSYDLQLQLLDEMLTKGDISEEEHAKKKLQIEKNLRDAKLKTLEDYGRAATELIDIVTQFNEAAKNRELKAAGDNDKKKQEIEKKYAKRQQTMAIAQTVIEGALEVARINSNAGVNADLTQTLRIVLTALAVGRTIASVALISSQQFAGGKYPVIGQDTGRTYQSAYVGPVRTGLYKGSSLGLFSEHEPEIVIDGPTTRRIQANYPGILSAIYSMKSNQYAGGKFPDLGSGGSAGSDFGGRANMAANTNAINRLVSILDRGISAESVWVYSEFDKMKREVEGIKQKTTIS